MLFQELLTKLTKQQRDEQRRPVEAGSNLHAPPQNQAILEVLGSAFQTPIAGYRISIERKFQTLKLHALPNKLLTFLPEVHLKLNRSRVQRGSIELIFFELIFFESDEKNSQY